MSTFILYLISILDSIVIASVLTSLILIALFIAFLGLGVGTYDDEDEQYYLRKSKKYFVLGVLFALIAVFTPSTNSMLAVYGYKNLYDFVQKNEKVQELPEKIIDITDKYIEYLDKELQNECIEK